VDSLLQDYFRNMMDEESANLVFRRVGLDKFKSWKENTVSPALWKNDSVTDFEPLDNQIEDNDIDMDEYCLDRAAFEKCLEEYLKQLPKLINGCIENSGIKASDVDLVIITGGHSQWYLVKEMLTGMMPQHGKLELSNIMDDTNRIIQISRPQETVALGMVYSSVRIAISTPHSIPVVIVNDEENNNESDSEAVITSEKLLAPVCKDGKWGYIDQTGILVIPCQWDDACDFSEGLASVKKNGKWGYIDKYANMVIPIQLRYASPFQDGIARVDGERNGLAFPYYIDKMGSILNSSEWRCRGRFSEGLAAVVGPNDKWGYIDREANIVIPMKYARAGDFYEGLAPVQNYTRFLGIMTSGDYGYIDKSGNLKIPHIWRGAYAFHEGFARVESVAGGYQFIDKTGKPISNTRWQFAGDFSEDLASVRDRNAGWGYIDQTGELVIPYQWYHVSEFSEGLASVRKNSENCYIDKSGHIVLSSTKWVYSGSFCNGLAKIQSQSRKEGFIDKSGNEVIPCIWDHVKSFR